MTDTLTLRIENRQTLDNGGPVSITLAGKGAQVGRKPGNDWVLPDPTRHISGHHFDVSYEGGGYVITDVSSNGTFLQGERYRLSGPHRVTDGDRFTVGQYIIRAEVTAAPAEAPAPPPEPEPVEDEFDDVWGDLGATPLPTPKGVQAPPHSTMSRGGSAPVQMPGQAAMPGAAGVSRPPTHQGGGYDSGLSMPPQFRQPPPAQPMPGPTPQMPEPPQAMQPEPFGMQPMPASRTMPEPVTGRGLGESFSEAGPPVGQSQQVQSAPGGGNADAMLAGFLLGAQLPDAGGMQIPPGELGRMLGRIARNGTMELMRMLQDRAAVKLFVSNEDRTMRVATGNNPMKFMPDSDQAFKALFIEPRDGYQTGADGFDNALTDVRRHQAAVIAAVQPALAEMLDGLSPAEIEDDVGGGLMGGGARKAWDEYSKRWEARAADGENGMLDAFIKAFSRHYSEALRKL